MDRNSITVMRTAAKAPNFTEMLLTASQLPLKVKILICQFIILFFPGKTDQFNVTTYYFSFYLFWPEGAGELSIAQSLKCMLIFNVIFQYIFYSLNLFENFCCLFYQKEKNPFILRAWLPRALNGHHFYSVDG